MASSPDLNGTGDRVSGTTGSGETVQSIVNLLRRFDISVPARLLRTRNVAAVLVTSEVSTYLRPGGRFEVAVSSLGDARSLRGGVLWMTPLVADAGGQPLAGAQGPIVISSRRREQRDRSTPSSARPARFRMAACSRQSSAPAARRVEHAAAARTRHHDRVAHRRGGRFGPRRQRDSPSCRIRAR